MEKKDSSQTQASARDRFIRPLLVGTGVGLLCTVAVASGLFSSSSARVADRFFTRTAPDPSILIVRIDDASIAEFGRWPWDRSVHADLIRALVKYGVSVIGYDVNFSEAQDAKNDGDLAEAIASSGRVVLPVELRITEGDSGGITYDSLRILKPTPSLASVAVGLGHSNTPPDADGVVRRIPIAVADGSGANSIASFADALAALARRAPEESQIPPEAGKRVAIRFNGPPLSAFPSVSAADVLSGKADPLQFRRKIVLVGSTASDLHDEQLVPTSDGAPMPGVEIHASFLDTLLKRSWLVQVPFWMLAALLIAIGAGFGFMVPRVRSRWSALAAFLLWVAILIVASSAFDRGHVLDVFWPTLAIPLSFGAVTLERRIASERRRRWLKGLLVRYVSPAIVDEILRHPERMALGGERKTMSVLFSDIRGFTPLSEKMSPEELVRCLNAYLGRMTDIVFEYDGVLDKYIGDAVMAFWNAPLDQPDHARRACLAALAMHEALLDINVQRIFGSHALRIGIGIHSGDMIVGNMGSEHHLDFTVIGDSVNLASRLEGLTKEYGADILISDAVWQAAGESIFARRIDRVAVKGKIKSVLIYEVLARADRVTPRDRERASAYESALDAYFGRAFEETISLCTEHLRNDPDDHPSRFLMEHAVALLKNPPPADWDGTWAYS